MKSVVIENVAPFDIDKALKTPEKYINEKTDIVLVKIHDPEEPNNPAMILAGVDEEGYYLCAEDNELCVYNTCDAKCPTLSDLYADLLKWVAGGYENPPWRTKTIKYTTLPYAIEEGLNNPDTFVINEEEPIELLRVYDCLQPDNPTIISVDEDANGFFISVQNNKYYFDHRISEGQSLFNVYKDALEQIVAWKNENLSKQNDGWISVRERCPETDGLYEVKTRETGEQKFCYTSQFLCPNWRHVTYWRPCQD